MSDLPEHAAQNRAAWDVFAAKYEEPGRRSWERDEDPPTVSFALGYGDWIWLLRANGFTVEDLLEVRVPEGATTRYPWADPKWARRWPSEEVWKARKA